ncbi:replication protein A 32 kDa subunit-B [Microplitis demolitor]|uniref:replication protein A 32 kDa subunit-B n=1 Tax=Microplitis demolitor TaxID=69319 RepID=UPI0004CCB550|nr:replication protein A 32 kDa subunit-B [Microplitis demolitor]
MWDQSRNEGEGGGGFMDESYSTIAPQADRGEAKRSNNVVPMMIGHLIKSSKKSKTIWGTNVNVVCIVAVVKDIQSQTTKIGYELEDETGKIMAYKWLEAESVVPEGITKDCYAKVYGTLREQGADMTTHIFVMKILPVKKYAEVFSHLLEVTLIAIRMKNSNNCLQGGKVEMPTGNNDDEDDDVCHGLTNEQKVIYKIIKRNDTENGIERGDLKSQVPGNLKSKVDGILEFLASEGHIYTTRNDDYFKAT